jgi:hypothetical protein
VLGFFTLLISSAIGFRNTLFPTVKKISFKY